MHQLAVLDHITQARQIRVRRIEVHFTQVWAIPHTHALERAESLEQLRALHGGARIHVAEAVERPGPGVDTAEDLERVRLLLVTSA